MQDCFAGKGLAYHLEKRDESAGFRKIRFFTPFRVTRDISP
jgi:hypothetical protein